MTSTAEPRALDRASPLVQELLALVAERVPASRSGAVREFALAYLRRMSDEIAHGLAAEELFGQVIGAFDLADGRGAAPMVVRAFNPSLASDG